MTFTSLQNAALLAMRVTVASVFFYAGWAKLPFWSTSPEGLSPYILFTTKFLTVAEPLGALAVLAGFMTRWAAGGLAVVMAGAIVIMQSLFGFGFASPTGTGWNFPLTLLACCLVLSAFGPGKWSIDALRPGVDRG